MNIDEALGFVGGYRRWNMLMFVLLGFSMFMPLCWQGLIVVFAGWEPPHRCRLLVEGQFTNENTPAATVSNRSEADIETKCSILSYEAYGNSTSLNNDNAAFRVTPLCDHGWVYENQGYFTFVEQWNLVCQYNYLSELSQTFYHVGSLLATIGLSFLIDKYGRKLVHIVSHIVICIVGLAIAFSNGYIMFVILKLLLGGAIMVNISSGMTYLMELFDSKRRTFAGIGLEFPWVICYLLLPAGVFYFPDWRTLQIIISCTSAIWIVYFWILPESPLWLEAIGRTEEAEAILHKMARWNGVVLSPEIKLLDSRKPIVETEPIDEHLNNQNSEEEKELANGFKYSTDQLPANKDAVVAVRLSSSSLKSKPNTENKKKPEAKSQPNRSLLQLILLMFRDRCLRRVLIICNLLWFTNCVVYYGLILSTPSLNGNRFLNFIVMGLVEVPAIFSAWFTADRYGRRLSTSVYHFIAGLPLAVVVFLPDTTQSGTNLTPLIITLIMISKFGISASFSVILLYTKELYPTNMRGSGGGLCQLLGNVGYVCSPFAAYLTKTSLYWVPNVFYGIISVVVALLVLMLPETVKKPLPQNIEDLHALFKEQARKSSIVKF